MSDTFNFFEKVLYVLCAVERKYDTVTVWKKTRINNIPISDVTHLEIYQVWINYQRTISLIGTNNT